MKNKVQLITYVDRLGGGNTHDLQNLLQGPLAGLFGAVHLLPFFYPIDGSDAGFDPIDHLQVDPRLGDWSDIQMLSQTLDIMGDVIVNHMSSESPQFKDFQKHGSQSDYAGLFLTLNSVFSQGATESDLAAIYRPRPGMPFTLTTLASGERRILWTTFTPQQIDIDVGHPLGQSYLQRILDTYAHNGVGMVRLDAIGYAVKKPGTSCFMIPETFEFIDEFSQQAKQRGIEVLVEIHAYYQTQIHIARRVDWVYDFALPPLVLHAIAFQTARHLKHWLAIRPTNALTVLDTHDGIGVIDIGADASDREGRPGLVPDHELDRLVEIIHERSAGTSRLATGAAASNLDLYQVNCTFYDALGGDDAQYLMARAIQFFFPGIPQVYYVGLLAGRNDVELLTRSKVGRDINRHYYAPDEVIAALDRAVVADLCELIRLRNSHPAFEGTFELLKSDDTVLHLRWTAGDEVAQLQVSLSSSEFVVLRTVAGVLQPLTLRCSENSVGVQNVVGY